MAAGTDHIAFTHADLGDLLYTYQRLKRAEFGTWGCAMIAGKAVGVFDDLAEVAARSTGLDGPAFTPRPDAQALYQPLVEAHDHALEAAVVDAGDPRFVILWDQLRLSGQPRRLSILEFACMQLFDGQHSLRDIQAAAMQQPTCARCDPFSLGALVCSSIFPASRSAHNICCTPSRALKLMLDH